MVFKGAAGVENGHTSSQRCIFQALRIQLRPALAKLTLRAKCAHRGRTGVSIRARGQTYQKQHRCHASFIVERYSLSHYSFALGILSVENIQTGLGSQSAGTKTLLLSFAANLLAALIVLPFFL